MGVKLEKGKFPSGHTPDDFECFGPIATKDGEFDSCKIADLGCFNQSGVDSNKAYCAMVVRSKKTKQWFCYFEWGRTGAKNRDKQFVQCSDEYDAQSEFISQCRSKNDKRGEWVTKPGLGRILQAKSGKDCYLVRPLATRDSSSFGLPDAVRITTGDVKVVKQASTNQKSKKDLIKYDKETTKLLRDFNIATITYAKTSVQGGTIPAQKSIDEGRIILTQALKRISILGDDLSDQIKDKDLRDLTFHLYSRIPKVKPVGAPESTWILSKDNIFSWNQDLDAFESALSAATVNIKEEQIQDPFSGIKIHMKHLPNGDINGDFIRSWMPRATRNVHYNIGNIKMHNVWEVERDGVKSKFIDFAEKIAKSKIDIKERPGQQPSKRIDTNSEIYQNSNVGMLFHGTRSVNVPGILREGLRFPKELVGVVITGAMFGPGHYWASDYKKSAGYTSLTSSYWAGGSGSVKGRQAFMFIADVALGKPHLAKGPHGYTSPPLGTHCVYGKAGYSGVQNDEWITFNKDQYQFRYLVEFSA